VPNGNFETYSTCPTGPSQINLAIPWYDPTGATSDYYNACANPSGIGVPSQGAIGYQLARSGNGYAGFYGSQNFGSNYREYIQIQLSTPLVSGYCYFVKFYTNLTNGTSFAINNIGAHLSNSPITTTAPNTLNVIPQIISASNPIIIDTVNWVEISGSYYASGGEQFLTIGNFKNDTNTTYQIIDTSIFALHLAYYYVDDVSIINCNDTSTSVQENENDHSFNLYPNPNTGNFSIKYDSKQSNDAVFKLYDIRGKLINETVLKNENTSFDFSDVLANGVYFYQVSINNKMVKSDKVVIIK